MKKHFGSCAAVLFTFSMAAADSSPKDGVNDAVKKLGEKSGYTWKTTIEWGGGNAGSVQGKTEKGGVTLLTLSRGDQSVEAVLRGGKGAVKTEDGWKTLAEASAEDQQGPTRMVARILQNFKAPVAEAEDLVTKTKELKIMEGTCTGDLTEDGAKELMRFGRRAGGGPEVKAAKGSTKFWIKVGVLSKYEYSLQGTMSSNGEDREVNRKITVEINELGKIKITIPEEAEKKLS